MSEENKDTPLNQLKTGLEELAEMNISDLVDKPNLGPFNFSQFTKNLEEIKEFSKNLLTLDLAALTEDRIEALRTSGEAMSTSISKLRSFKPENVDNPNSTRDSLGQNLRDTFNNFVAVARHDLPFLLLKRKPIGEEELGQQLVTATEILEKLRGLEDQMSSILEASRTAAGQIGVDAHSIDFSTLAGEHKTIANRWLIAVALLILAAISVPILYLNFFAFEGDLSTIGNIQRIITKISILFILYFLIAQATKNYRTHRHLYVSNKHRETSLKTFRTFVESADTDQTVKMQILLEAARTVFTPSHTGYIANEEENPNSRIVEIMKMVKDGKP